MSQIDLLANRPWNPGDFNFVKATWLKSLRFGNAWFAKSEGSSYYKAYSTVLDKILSTPGVEVTVACLCDDPELILGYSVQRGNTLDFVYVKKRWRGVGIATSLVSPNIDTVTHLTDTGKSILDKKFPEIVFNPWSP